MSDKYAIYNETTGDRIGNYTPKKKSKFDSFYVLTFYENLNVNINFLSFLIIGSMDKTNRISLSPKQREDISRQAKVKINTIDVQIKRLCRDLVLLRERHGIYFVNPYCFTKTNVDKVRGLRIEYDRIIRESLIAKNKPKIKKKETLVNVYKINSN